MRRLVVGGTPIQADVAPFVVRLYTPARGIGFCGGTLLNARDVLTAAHCVVNDTLAVMNVASLLVGTFQTDVYATDTEVYSDVVEVEGIHVHPDYVNVANGHDLAVVRLARAPARFGLTPGPHAVALDDGSFWRPDGYSGGPTFVLGYGADVYGGPQSYFLEAARVRRYTDAECTSFFGWSLSASNRCAGLDGADACSGDSGGPLVTTHNGRVVQTGVVSWGVAGSECGDAAAPGIYALIDRAFVQAAASDAVTFQTFAPAASVTDPCACTCVSNGFSVAPRCGCAEHVDGDAFCYVQSAQCTAATESFFVLGAMYRTCDVPPPALPPSMPPALPPSMPLALPSFMPPALPPSMPPSMLARSCDSKRQAFLENGCCETHGAICETIATEYRTYGCCA